jgi:hypothetical protein
VVAHFSEGGRAQHGALYIPENLPDTSASLGESFLVDDSRSMSLAALRDRAQPLTFTAVPPGEGRRSGIDRDLDGVLDGASR